MQVSAGQMDSCTDFTVSDSLAFIEEKGCVFQ